MAKIHATTRPENIWPEIWSNMSKKSRQKEKQHRQKKKSKLDKARKLKGIYCFDPEDMKFKENVNMREGSGNSMWTLQCRANCDRSQENHPWRRQRIHKRKFATGTRREKSFAKTTRKETQLFTHAKVKSRNLQESSVQRYKNRHHGDLIAEKENNSVSHYNLFHIAIPMPQAVINSRCNGRSCQRVGQIKELASMARIRSQK